MMDAKLLNLSELLYQIQDMQEKINLQITDLKQDYFCYTEPNVGLYERAKLNCSIAEDYSNNIAYAIDEAREAIEELIGESADRQRVGA